MSYDILPPGEIAGLFYDEKQTFYWPFDHLMIDGREREKAFNWLDEHHKDKVAVMLGCFGEMVYLEEGLSIADEDGKAAQDIMQAASKLTVKSWLKQKEEEEQRLRVEFSIGEDDEEFGVPRGKWPLHPRPQNSFQGHMDYATGLPYQQVYLTLLPVDEAALWAAPLRWGGWNNCPMPEVHIMLARQWAELYGARIRTVTHDLVEYEIARPITTKEEALEMAQLQYKYCNDVIDQGFDTLENLAASLIGATVWYFWWD